MNVIQIPVSSHVKKYILQEYGPEPIYLTRKNELGNYVSNLLENQGFNINRLPKKTDCMLGFELNSRFKKSFITEDKAKKLAYHFDQQFKKAFCKHINNFYSFGFYYEEGIEDFYSKYQIEETEYSRDSMRRYFDRYGKEELSGSERRKPKMTIKTFSDHVLPISTFQSQKLDFFKANFKPDENKGLTRREAFQIARERNEPLLMAS